MDTTNIDNAFSNVLGALTTKFDHLRTGVSETGVFNISISGAAGTAARLATGARINSVLFDGSTNISMPSLYDANGNLLLWGNSAANAVNYVSLTNAAAGNGVSLTASGSDIAVPLTVATKALGVLTLQGGANIDLRPINGQVRVFGPGNVGSWALNLNGSVSARTLNLPVDGDVTMPSGTLVALGGTNVFTASNTFNLPLQVKNTFNISTTTPGSQQNGLYMTEFTTSQGVIGCPTNTVAIAAQTAANRSIALSVDQSGYLWGYVGNPINGQAVFTSKVRTADTLATSRALTLSGDITGTVGFDGSSDVSIPAILTNTGITAGTYNNLTVDSKGRAIGGSNVAYLTSNQTINFSGDVQGIGSQSINLTLVDTGVAAGTYNNVTVDTKGRVIAGTVVNYGSGGGGTGGSTSITSADIIAALGYTPANAATVGNSSGSFTLGSTPINNGNTITVVNGLTSIQATNFYGNASTASKLANAAIIQATGDALWSTSFDGGSLATGVLTLSTVNASPVTNSLVRITVDGKGRVVSTTPASPTDISAALGYTAARAGNNTDILSITGNAATASALQTSRQLVLSGHISATLAFDGSANVNANATLATTGVTPGTYNSVTVDAYGRVTAATNVATSPTGITIPGISFANGKYIFSGHVNAGDFITNDGSITGSTVATSGITKDSNGNFAFNANVVAPAFYTNDGSIPTNGITVTLSNVTLDAQGRFVFDAPIVANEFDVTSGAASTMTLAGVTYNASQGMYIFNGPLYATAFDMNPAGAPQGTNSNAAGIGVDGSGNFVVAGPVYARELLINDGSYGAGNSNILPGVTIDDSGNYIFNGILVANAFDVNPGTIVATTTATGVSVMNAFRRRLSASHPIISADEPLMGNHIEGQISKPGQVLDRFMMSEFRTAEYLLTAQATLETGTVFESVRFIVLHDDQAAYLAVGSRVSSGPELVDLSVTVVGKNVNVLVTPVDSGVKIKARRTTVGV